MTNGGIFGLQVFALNENGQLYREPPGGQFGGWFSFGGSLISF